MLQPIEEKELIEMTTLSVHEMLKREVDLLPETLAEEVIDSVLFVKEQRAGAMFLWQQVRETQAYWQHNPQGVIIAAADEWEEATRHLE